MADPGLRQACLKPQPVLSEVLACLNRGWSAEAAEAEVGRGWALPRGSQQGGARSSSEGGGAAAQGLWQCPLRQHLTTRCGIETSSCCFWHQRCHFGLIQLLVGSFGISCEVFFLMKRLTVTVHYVSSQAHSRTADGTEAKNQAGDPPAFPHLEFALSASAEPFLSPFYGNPEEQRRWSRVTGQINHITAAATYQAAVIWGHRPDTFCPTSTTVTAPLMQEGS